MEPVDPTVQSNPLDVHAKPALPGERRYAPASTVHWTDAGGELLLFDRVRGSYHALNGPASAIWRALAADGSAAVVVERLAERFDTDRDTIAAGVASFLSSALADGLIVEVA
jgi:Coenzyme PQQ synthesis protein D (PqqD)